MPDESSLRVEIGLRGAIIAKQALELLGVDPRLAPLQLREVEQAVSDMKDFLRKKGLAK